MKRLLLFYILLLILNKELIATDLVIIANSSIKTNLSIAEIKKIYLKQKLFINGNKIIPVNLKNNSQLRKIFNEKVLNMDNEELSLYWNEKYFHGIKPPTVLSSEEAVARFVRKVKFSIGYISLKKYKLLKYKDIKVIKIIKVGQNEKDINN